MPSNLKIYQQGKPGLDPYIAENNTFTFDDSETARFPKFKPFTPSKGIDAGKDFYF